MSKRILAAAVTAVALSLTACGGAEENNVAIENVEDLNATEDLNMGMDMNADVNMDMNADVNATDNATGNEATDNTTNSY
jgi:hypothetical protein